MAACVPGGLPLESCAAMNDAPALPEIPGYRLIQPLGRGGMASVWLATQESLDRSVAIKILDPPRAAGEEWLQRFASEAHTIARLDHPNVVGIFDVGRTSDGRPYYTMPYLPNGDLSTRIPYADPAALLDVLRALADALGHAHEQGIIHRDVKPENVLFDRFDRPLLADFGIALDSIPGHRITQSGAMVGSSNYMSPEQARGLPLDGRSDLYSLGVLCYEMLTGELPFRGSGPLSVALAHLEARIPRLPAQHRAWQPLIDRALAKQPAERPQDAAQFLALLDAVDARLNAPPPGPVLRFVREGVDRITAVRRPVRVAITGVALLSAIGIMLAVMPHAPGPPTAAMTGTAPAADISGEIGGRKASRAPPVRNVTVASLDMAPLPDVYGPPVSLAGIDEAAIARQMKAAERLASAGHVATPKGDSAVDAYLRVLALDPKRTEARQAIDGLAGLLAKKLAPAIAVDDVKSSRTILAEGEALAARLKATGSEGIQALTSMIDRDIDARIGRIGGGLVVAPLQTWRELLPELSKVDAAAAAKVRDTLAAKRHLLEAGGPLRDHGGPALLIVPAASGPAGGEPPFAIALHAVGRGDWAAFANPANRKPSGCRIPGKLLSRFRGLDWRDPGFAQDDSQPAVCVSWDDAETYARWLSQHTGHTYRLPSEREWTLASRDPGLAATMPRVRASDKDREARAVRADADLAGIWLSGCAKQDRDHRTCESRWFSRLPSGAGNGSGPGDADADVGYTTIGIRLVRELDAQELAAAK